MKLVRTLLFIFWCVGVTKSNAQTWTKVDAGTTHHLLDVRFFDANNGWVVGGNGGSEKGKILRTINSGGSFTNHPTDFFNDIKSIAATDMNTAWIADGSITIRHTKDGGKIWAAQTPGPSPTFPYNLLKDVFFINATVGWTVGDNGTIYKTVNGGSAWTKQNSNTAESLKAVFFIDANMGWAVGMNTTFLRTIDGGATWNPITIDLIPVLQGEALNNIFFIDANHGWVPLYNGGGPILYTTNGGKTFTTVYAGGGSIISSVFFTDTNNGWAVGTFGAIFKSTDGGLSWQIYQDIGDNSLSGVYFTDSSHGWATGSYGTLYKYSSGTSSNSKPVDLIFNNSIIKTSPNPFNNSLTIELATFAENSVLELYSVHGQKMLSAPVLSKTYNLKTEDLPSGIYFLNLVGDKRVLASRKVVKE